MYVGLLQLKMTLVNMSKFQNANKYVLLSLAFIFLLKLFRRHIYSVPKNDNID